MQNGLRRDFLGMKNRLIKWIVGLLSAGLGGVGYGAGGVILAPEEINLDQGIHKLAGLFLIGFILQAFAYCQKSPLYNALYEPEPEPNKPADK